MPVQKNTCANWYVTAADGWRQPNVPDRRSLPHTRQETYQRGDYSVITCQNLNLVRPCRREGCSPCENVTKNPPAARYRPHPEGRSPTASIVLGVNPTLRACCVVCFAGAAVFARWDFRDRWDLVGK